VSTITNSEPTAPILATQPSLATAARNKPPTFLATSIEWRPEKVRP
jgi:hypothetical protein